MMNMLFSRIDEILDGVLDVFEDKMIYMGEIERLRKEISARDERISELKEEIEDLRSYISPQR